ncbi:hypothetical protein [Salinibaculum rarum]|uniref:hypothetical protein n=1 Tax=Salinibaculum rarum TaxID=3058903 RepID=UPI00265E8E95|nr:hypothetical protein [Salinibaculum sp. KK48]
MYTVTESIDARPEQNRLRIIVESESGSKNAHTFIFTPFDLDYNEWVPKSVTTHSSNEQVNIGVIFNGGLETAIEYVETHYGLNVPFNQPGFGQ